MCCEHDHQIRLSSRPQGDASLDGRYRVSHHAIHHERGTNQLSAQLGRWRSLDMLDEEAAAG